MLKVPRLRCAAGLVLGSAGAVFSQQPIALCNDEEFKRSPGHSDVVRQATVRTATELERRYSRRYSARHKCCSKTCCLCECLPAVR